MSESLAYASEIHLHIGFRIITIATRDILPTLTIYIVVLPYFLVLEYMELFAFLLKPNAYICNQLIETND